MVSYLRDQCMVVEPGQPQVVVLAECTSDVVAALAWAQRHRVAVVTRGAGSGLSGGAAAFEECLVPSTERMTRIREIDTRSRIAVVEAGVVNAELDAEARKLGLWYPPDPGSKAISTIGGNAATNPGGMCCVKYGVTGDHTLAMTVVLADGQVARLGSLTRKNVAGLDLLSLVVGSEGTLGVIVDLTVRLRSATTTTTVTGTASFGTTDAAVAAVLQLTATTSPSAVELLDRTTIRAVNSLRCRLRCWRPAPTSRPP
jgi:glycolate oxidase